MFMKLDSPNWAPGPVLLTTAKRITPKLLRLKWKGYPLYHDKKDGWGFVVPCKLYDLLKREFWVIKLST